MAAIRSGVRAVPTIIRDTTWLAARDRVLRQLLVITFLIGMVLSTLELIGPLRFAELTGSRTDGTAVFGVVMALWCSGCARSPSSGSGWHRRSLLRRPRVRSFT